MCRLSVACRKKKNPIKTVGVVTSAGAETAVNLFDRVISNDGDTETEAVAHETPVLLPPRSRFLMSDVTRLRPLLPGAAAQHPWPHLPQHQIQSKWFLSYLPSQLRVVQAAAAKVCTGGGAVLSPGHSS